MTHRPKILFCDVDRTLLTHSHVLLPKVTEAIGRATKAGLQVILASARSPVGAGHIHASLGLTGPIICFNGAWAGMPGEPRPWQRAGLDRSTAMDVLRCGLNAGLAPMWYGAAKVFATERFAEVATKQSMVTRDHLELVRSPQDIPEDPYKIMLVAPPDGVDSALPKLVAACGGTVSIMRSGPGLIEVVRKGISKATSAARVAERLGVVRQDCAAVGDSENDLELLRWVGLPLTVANGLAEAQKVARFVGGYCDEAGLVDVIDWLLALPADQQTTAPRPSRWRSTST